ncbi:MAG: PEP-CTERM sorting domain-containing protein [Armatimonadota bacterium]
MKGMFTFSGRAWTVALVLVLVACGCAVYAQSFVDNFSDSSSLNNWNGWGPTGWQSIDNGILTMTPPGQDDGLWVTSNQTFLYGTYEIKFRTENAPYNRLYFGFFSRSPWANPIACMRTDLNLMLAAGDGGPGSNWDALNPNSPYLTPDVWHTLKLIWQPGSIESILDGSSLGTYTEHVASTAMPLVMDAGRGGVNSTVPLVFEIDYVSVTPVPEPSALVSLLGLTGAFGLFIRRRA